MAFFENIARKISGMKVLSFLALVATALSAHGAAWTNPVWPADCADPTFWLASDGTWRCSSTAKSILRSKDFFHWEDTGKRLFTDEEYARISKEWAHIWAPDMFKLGDEYLLFVSLVNRLEDSAIAVYSSKDPEGPFTDGRILTKGRDTGIYDTIDPEAVRDEKTGDLVFDGSFVNGKYDGTGSLYKDGELLYSGGFKEGKYDGTGSLYKDGKLVYTGGFTEGKYSGEGTFYDENGEVTAQGKLDDSGNLVTGYVRIKSGDQLIYDGNIENGVYQGEGKLYQNGQLLYSGSFDEGKYNGNGRLYNSYGIMIYDGGFYMGRYDGQGREFYDNGVIKYIGEFRYGTETGNGTFYDENGQEIIKEEPSAPSQPETSAAPAA